MKILKRILPLVLVLVMLVSNVSVASAASASKPEWVGTGKVRSRVFLGDKEIKPTGCYIYGVDYFAVKDIAKLLKDTKKKFNFKFNLDKNTLTFYPGKAYNSKDTGVTVKKNKAETQWDNDVASNRGTKVYNASKKVSTTVYILKGTFFMKLEDIAKIIDCGIAYTDASYEKKFKLDVKKSYNGLEEFTADLSNVTTKVVIGSPDNAPITDTTGVIKPLFDDAKLVKNPKTVKDFEKLYKYMVVNNIITCSVETNVAFNDIFMKGSVYDNAVSATMVISKLYHGVTGGVQVTVVGTGTNCKLNIKLTTSGKAIKDKELAKKNKEYTAEIINVLQELIDGGKLKADMTETQKAEVLAHWMADNVSFGKGTDTVTYYDAVMKRRANCSGFTSFYNLLCRYVGIYNIAYIGGTHIETGGRHAWTAYVLDGKKVMTDATFFFHNMKFFAQSAKTFRKDHVTWDETAYPDWK